VYDAVQAGNDAEATVLVIIISTVCLTILVVSGQALKAGYR
jgi:ABC-type molybdate transport system permease subunit